MNPTSSAGGVTEATMVRNATGGDAHTPLITDALSDPGAPRVQATHVSHPEHSVSTSTTVTELTMSPSADAAPAIVVTDPVSHNNKSNRNMNNAKNNRVFQPHQGQNPTVERNTHKKSDEELTILGNKLVDKQAIGGGGGSDSGSEYRHHENIFDAIADNLESSLVQNDSLNQQQRQAVAPLLSGLGVGVGTGAPQPVNPPPSIRYLQNHVNLSEPLVVRPKMPNVPGNGASAPSARAAAATDKKSRFPFSKKPKSDKNKENKNKGFSFPFFGRKSHGSENGNESTEDFYPTENLVHNPLPLAQSVLCKPGPSGQGAEGVDAARMSREIEGKSNLEPRPVSTEVRLMNGTPIVRPTSLAVESRGGRSRAPAAATAVSAVPGYNIDQTALSGGATGGDAADPAPTTEVGVAKLQRNPLLAANSAQPAVLRVKGKSHSSGDLSPPSRQQHSGAAAAALMNNQSNCSVNQTPSVVGTSHNDIIGVHKNSSCSTTSSNRSTPSDRTLLNNSLEYIQATQSMDRHPRTRHGLHATGGGVGVGGPDGTLALKNGRAATLRDDRVISLSAGDISVATASSPWQPDDALEKPVNKSAISLQQFDSSLDASCRPVQDFEC